MNFDYRLLNNRRCLRNVQCSSGYCRSGRCNDPEKKHDPCRPGIGNCPKSLQCSESSQTCVPNGYKASKVCITASDCKFNQLCMKGSCQSNILIGNNCKTIKPDLCVEGSKCTVSLSNSEPTKCYELCSNQVPCPSGYKCTENIWNADPICVPIQNQPVKAYSANSDEAVQAVVIVVAIIIVFLGIIYCWIRLTRSGRDPRLFSSTGKKKKKKVRLSYEGNGLATITVIPSNCQSPIPVAASQLFNVSMNEAPPAYSEIINIR